MTLPQIDRIDRRLLELLDSGYQQTEIRKILGFNTVSSVRSRIKKLMSFGYLERVAWGVYKAIQIPDIESPKIFWDAQLKEIDKTILKNILKMQNAKNRYPRPIKQLAEILAYSKGYLYIRLRFLTSIGYIINLCPKQWIINPEAMSLIQTI